MGIVPLLAYLSRRKDGDEGCCPDYDAFEADLLIFIGSIALLLLLGAGIVWLGWDIVCTTR